MDASAQDGALYISMWREDDLREELAIRSRFTPAAREKTPPASALEENAEEAAVSVDDLPPEDDEPADVTDIPVEAQDAPAETAAPADEPEPEEALDYATLFTWEPAP